MKKTVLFWGNYDADYSRNRIIAWAFQQLGWQINSYRSNKPRWAYLKARVTGVSKPDLVFVPAFCQKDILPAIRFARYHHIPVMADPLISLYDTRVFERKTISEHSYEAKKLFQQEQLAYQALDSLLLDTEAHLIYFRDTFNLDTQKITVVPVSAEESIFTADNISKYPNSNKLEVLFYGSFIPLQGVEVIADAIKLCQKNINWHFIGGKKSHLREKIQESLSDFDNVTFEDDIAYDQLPSRIKQADVILGVFGISNKTARVIPNKVYQALACGRLVVTCNGPYPKETIGTHATTGIIFTPQGDAQALSKVIDNLAYQTTHNIQKGGQDALQLYTQYFSNKYVQQTLDIALKSLRL